VDELRERLVAKIGQPMGADGPALAPDEVNAPMIRHWVDALDDRNAAYDETRAEATRFGGLVAPPTMMQTWTMGRPTIRGIAERGGAAGEQDSNGPLPILAANGFTGTLATNSVLEFGRYLRVGDRLTATNTLESISDRKHTGLGRGYFVTWAIDYADAVGDPVGRQLFTVYRFCPGPPPERSAGGGGRTPAPEPTGEELPPFDLDVTATVIVAGAIASRDFMPVHHDRDYAIAQGAPDLFMNILTSTGYVSRFVTDWSGPDAVLRRIAIRLGSPCIPGQPLRFRGRVSSDSVVDDAREVEVTLSADTDLGNHLAGTVVLSLPSH
jgi:hydroxyacyl-ACP dehydratase HTD2-like protein with hotdog domain